MNVKYINPFLTAIVDILKVSTKEIGKQNKEWNSWYTCCSKKIKFFEFLIFGSTVGKCDDESVGDLDMMIIDNNAISPDYHVDCDCDDWYTGLSGHLPGLLREYSDNLLYNINNAAAMDIAEKIDKLVEKMIDQKMKVDLHFLPLKFFKSKKYRMEVLSKHKDPNFFKNCFDNILRLRCGKQFVPVSVSYFEYKYRRNLQDLKK